MVALFCCVFLLCFSVQNGTVGQRTPSIVTNFLMTPVTLRFLPDNITITAEPGEALITVAARAGITIPTGCMMGSCHACEVEMDGEPICSCLTAVPPTDAEIVIDLYSDPNW